MSLYSEKPRIASVALPHADDIAASIVATDHFDNLPYHEFLSSNPDHPEVQALPRTSRALIENATRELNIGTNEFSNGRAVSLREFVDFVSHEANLGKFESMIESLMASNSNDAEHQLEAINRIEKIATRLLQLHNLCEIARQRTLLDYKNKAEHHAAIHATHDRIGEGIKSLYERIRQKVAADFTHDLPQFSEGAQHFGLIHEPWENRPSASVVEAATLELLRQARSTRDQTAPVGAAGAEDNVRVLRTRSTQQALIAAALLKQKMGGRDSASILRPDFATPRPKVPAGGVA